MRTKLKARFLPYGALPYDNIRLITNMMAKLFPAFPYLPILPNLSNEDTLAYRTLSGMPGVIVDGENITLKAGTKQYEKEISDLEKVYNNPDEDSLEKYAFDAPFMDKYLNIIKKFKSPNACINLLGPFTVSQLLMNAAKEQMLADKSFRKLFVQSVCIKAMWLINKIKEYCPTTVPVVVLEEPLLGQLGVVKRQDENITKEIVINMIARVVEKLHDAGALVAIQCMEKCDWTVPIDAGADIISFDAYNNPNNINIIPEQIKSFLFHGGMICWCIIPVISEKHIKELSTDYLMNRLEITMQGLSLADVPIELIRKTALVSTNNNANNLPIMFAEKALIITTKIASRLAISSHSR